MKGRDEETKSKKACKGATRKEDVVWAVVVRLEDIVERRRWARWDGGRARNTLWLAGSGAAARLPLAACRRPVRQD